MGRCSFDCGSQSGHRARANLFPKLASAIRDASVLLDSGLPTHRPLQVGFDLGAFCQPIWRLRRPRKFPLQQWRKWAKLQEEALATEVLQNWGDTWQRAALSSS
eukprot:5701604-Karenia_brevis.AAC.1